MISRFLLALFLILLHETSQAATLTAAAITGIYPGDNTVVIPVSLTTQTGEFVAAVQVDVAFEPEALSFTKATAGDSATAANKTLSFNQIDTGVKRIILSGLNQNVIPDGTVFNMTFSVKNAATAGAHPITLSNLSLVSSSGVHIAGNCVNGAIEIIAVEGENEGEGETEGEDGSDDGCFAKKSVTPTSFNAADTTTYLALLGLLGLWRRHKKGS